MIQAHDQCHGTCSNNIAIPCLEEIVTYEGFIDQVDRTISRVETAVSGFLNRHCALGRDDFRRTHENAVIQHPQIEVFYDQNL